MGKILCVAEKPSIAKAVSQHLGGNYQINHVRGNQYLKNYVFNYRFQGPWGNSQVVFTSVAGHIVSYDFDSRFRSWNSCRPEQLFDANIISFVGEDKKVHAKNIEEQARQCSALFIWTDCDREGEAIGAEVRDIALKANPRLEVKRARFSNIEHAHVIQAAGNPVTLDERQVRAVSARQELDLRIGSIFTRLQTLNLRPMIEDRLGADQKKIISYGSCQFPTLGFVVDRYFRVKNFVPEPFWHIKVMHKKDDVDVNFRWRRDHLFDRMAVVILFERCIRSKIAEVTKVQTKPTSKWRPLPLTTVELQKMGTKYLRMNSSTVMKVAEDLYTKGFISYPRTETDRFDAGMDLKKIIEKQQQDNQWGTYAQSLLAGAFRQPRNGKNDDKAHPPIHPVNYVVATQLNPDEKKVYEFVVRRFLACCSDDAKGQATDVEIKYGQEFFQTHGLLVLQRNYLDVYPYDKWESSQQLPVFTTGETFEPTEAVMAEGATTGPSYLTEPELIALMDVNGIGTDATMAEHIKTIQDRAYVMTRPKGGGGGRAGGDVETPAGRGRGRGGRGRGASRGGGRGGAAAASSTSTTGVNEFIPTTLGVALVEGYDKLSLETSLSKPFLRKEMELHMKAICEGTMNRNDVVQQSLDQYRAIYAKTTDQLGVLKSAFRKYILGTTDG